MKPSRLSAGPLAVLAAVTLNASAAEWLAEPSITARAEYNDNIRLTTVEHDDVWGLIVDPKLKLSRRMELWDASASTRLRAERYEGQDGLNTVDNFFDVALARRFERGGLDVSAALAKDTTLQNESLDLDTGLTIDQIDRTRRDLRIAANYMFTEATWLEATVDYSTVEYDDGERYGLLDYDYLTPGLRLIHQLDPKTQVFAVLSHAKVDYDTASELESKTDSLQLGAVYEFTERWKLSGSIGSRRTRTSQLVPTLVPVPGFEFFFPLFSTTELLPRDSESTGLVYNATLTRKFETGNLDLNATRSVTPSSTGTDTDTTAVTLTANRRFTTKLSGRLAVSYFQSETVGETRTTADRDRYRVGPSLSWQLDEDLLLHGGYTYTHLSRTSGGSDAVDSNVAFISLGYTWPRMSASR